MGIVRKPLTPTPRLRHAAPLALRVTSPSNITSYTSPDADFSSVAGDRLYTLIDAYPEHCNPFH